MITANQVLEKIMSSIEGDDVQKSNLYAYLSGVTSEMPNKVNQLKVIEEKNYKLSKFCFTQEEEKEPEAEIIINRFVAVFSKNNPNIVKHMFKFINSIKRIDVLYAAGVEEAFVNCIVTEAMRIQEPYHIYFQLLNLQEPAKEIIKRFPKIESYY